MQISSVSSLYSILYGTTSATSATSATSTNTSYQNILSDLSSTSTSEDEVTLSSDYEEFKSFLDKVKDGTVTEEDLASMQELLSTTDLQSMMPPPPPPMPTDSADAGSTEVSSVGASTVSGSSQDSTNMDSISSFLDKVKEGTVTEDDLTEMQDLLTAMDEQGIQMPPPMPPMMGISPTSSEDSESSDETSILDSSDLETLMSFFEKVKEGTVTEDDLTSIQELLLSQEESIGTVETDDLSDV